MHTEQPAVRTADRLTQELSAWESAMPGDGFTEEQISKRLSSARECIRQIGEHAGGAVGCYRDLDSRVVSAWLSKRLGEKTMKKKTARTYLSLLNAWGESLKAAGIINVVPTDSIKGPKGADAPGPGQRPFTGEEQQRIIAAARADEAKDQPRHKDRRSMAYELLGASGGRRRETTRLRVCDVNLDEYPPTVTFLGKNGRVDSVPLVPRAVEALRAWIDELAPSRHDDPLFPPHPHPMKFPADRVLISDMEAAGIERVDKRHRAARWGSFRKGLATMLIEAGVDQSHAQKLLRHRTTEMTMNTYAKVRDGKMLDVLMRTDLVDQSAQREKNVKENVASGADCRYSELASLSDSTMQRDTNHITGRDAGTHGSVAEDWLSRANGRALPRVSSVVSPVLGGEIRPASGVSDLSEVPRGGLEPPHAMLADAGRADSKVGLGHLRAHQGSEGVTDNEGTNGLPPIHGGGGAVHRLDSGDLRGGNRVARTEQEAIDPDPVRNARLHDGQRDTGSPVVSGREGQGRTVQGQALTPPGVEAGTNDTCDGESRSRTGTSFGASSHRGSDPCGVEGRAFIKHCATPTAGIQPGHGSSPTASGGAVAQSPSPHASVGAGTPGAGIDPPEQTLSTHDRVAPSAFSDDIAAAQNCLNRAREAHTQGKVKTMRAWKRAAAAILFAGTAIGAPNVRPSEGYDCWLWFCSTASTYTQCLICCFGYCSANPQMEDDCQKACAGGGGMPTTAAIALDVALRAESVASLPPNDRTLTTNMMTRLAGGSDPDLAERVSHAAADLPLETERQMVKQAYEARYQPSDPGAAS